MDLASASDTAVVWPGCDERHARVHAPKLTAAAVRVRSDHRRAADAAFTKRSAGAARQVREVAGSSSEAAPRGHRDVRAHMPCDLS